MGLLVDSSVLIDLERKGMSPEVLTENGDETLAISTITVSELLFGLHRAVTAEQRSRRQEFIDTSLALLAVLPFDHEIAEVHARIWAALVTAGQRIGAHDFMIAATALAYEYAVLTHNAREFSRIPGLEVRQPGW